MTGLVEVIPGALEGVFGEFGGEFRSPGGAVLFGFAGFEFEEATGGFFRAGGTDAREVGDGWDRLAVGGANAGGAGVPEPPRDPGHPGEGDHEQGKAERTLHPGEKATAGGAEGSAATRRVESGCEGISGRS
jgi:hypothetical protein